MTINVTGSITFPRDRTAVFTDARAFVFAGPALTNDGTITVTSAIDGHRILGIQAGYGAIDTGPLFRNSASGRFTVTATGRDGAAWGYYADSWLQDFTNDGYFSVSSLSGTAQGVLSSDNTFILTNSGTFNVSGYDAEFAFFMNGGKVVNSGQLTVTGQDFADGIRSYAGTSAGGLTFTNTGSLVVSSTNNASVAIEIANYGKDTIVNSGQITGDFAIARVDWITSPEYGAVNLTNTGVINGVIELESELDLGDDVITNRGVINGIVDLGGGNDTYDGTGGTQNGAVLGGRGNDTIIGTAASDTLYSESGDDVLTGGGGDDTLVGGDGYDTVVMAGPSSNYSLTVIGKGVFQLTDNTGRDGSDILYEVEAIRYTDTTTYLRPVISGTSGNDTINGTSGPDVILGGDGNDVIYGGDSYDMLCGGRGSNTLYGGDGDDLLDSPSFGSVIDGGAGTDTVTFSDNFQAITFDLRSSPGWITVTNVENVVGTFYDDTITGDAGDNWLWGGDGDDTLDGAGGNDTLVGGYGNDFASFASSTSGVTASLATGVATSASGHVVLSEIEGLIGSNQNDTLTGSDGDDIIAGGYGTNVLNGGAGFDFVAYDHYAPDTVGNLGVHVDLSLQGSPQDTGGGSVDTLTGFEGIIGTRDGDWLVGDAGNNVLAGGSGSNRLDGGGGTDTVIMDFWLSDCTFSIEAGAYVISRGSTHSTIVNCEFVQFTDQTVAIADLPWPQTIIGTDGNDTLTGGNGNDTIDARGGDDVIYATANPVVDSIDGGNGFDTVVFSGSYDQYSVSYNHPGDTVMIMVTGPFNMGGLDSWYLYNVEQLRFSDHTIAVPTGFDDPPQGTNDNNNLSWGPYDDVINGLAGNDILAGMGGDDTIDGGIGDDTLNGGDGNDTATYKSAQGPVRVSLAIAGAQNTGSHGTDTLIAIENLDGSEFDDTLTGDSGNNMITGRGGNDTLDGGAGNDIAKFSGNRSAYTVTANTNGSYTVTGTDGTDTLTNIEMLQFDDQSVAPASIATPAQPSGGQTISGTSGADTLTGGSDNDTITGGAGNDIINGGAGSDTLNGGDDEDTITGGAGNDALDGGSSVDKAVFSGNRSAYTITQTSTGNFTITGPDGTDTLTNIEYAKFDDQTLRLLPGSGSTVNFAADPSTFMGSIRDFDGNNLGGAASWKLIGTADVNGDGRAEHILFNREIGRWAEVGTEPDGLTYFSNYNWAGDTRVVGIYIDPLVANGTVVKDSATDSQRRFQNDLQIDNIHGILGQGDYNHDGLQEVYFSLTDGTAYLHAYMHADGNIQYANYQNKQQVIDYLTSNGVSSSTWATWFPASQSVMVAVAG